MKLLVFISLFGGLLLASCGGVVHKKASTQEVNPADTIYLGDLRENLKETAYSLKLLLLI